MKYLTIERVALALLAAVLVCLSQAAAAAAGGGNSEIAKLCQKAGGRPSFVQTARPLQARATASPTAPREERPVTQAKP